jgi:hypothetical protein
MEKKEAERDVSWKLEEVESRKKQEEGIKYAE